MPGRRVSLVWPHDPTLYAPPKYRRACRYEAFIPDWLHTVQPDLDTATAGLVSEAEHAIRDLNAVAHPALVPLARLLLRSESIASSKIEGMQVGTRELARAEARLESGDKSGTTVREILANIDAMTLAVQRGASARTFTVAHVVAIHRRLMAASANPRIAGVIRTDQNWIGGNDYTPCGADFVPPPPQQVSALLEDLCAAVNDDRLPPVVQAALVHAQFETIHPFADRNGRTGRALIHIVLKRRGIAVAYVPPVSITLALHRARYIEGLTRFRGDDVAGWIAQFAGAAASAARLAREYVDAVSALTERWRGMLAKHSAPRADAAAWAIIDVLAAHPALTAQAVLRETARARAAAYQGISQLVEAGVLVPASTSKRNQMWEPAGLMNLLVGLDAGRSP
jgi:Fic family protein